ncbi:MAG: hypothetical protein ACREOI_16490 [bacterium]
MNVKFSKIICWCQVIIALLCALVLSDDHAFSQSTASTTDSVWKIVITSKDEPGEPLIVSGTVYKPDGKTSVEGITVYVYHTDAEGYYRKGSNSSSNPRLHGTMRTNAEGKYEFRTIKPGAYPGGGNPAHIHYVLSGKGYEKQNDEVMFEGDPYLTPRDRSSISVRPLARGKDGVWRCVYDIKLK